MKHFLREFGLFILLSAIGIGGYLYYSQNRDNILSFSLDRIGEQLVQMVDDPASRALIANRFESFKEKVLADEVDPTLVEGMTANVLNLKNSGATISPEEAELMLDFAEAPERIALPEPAYLEGVEFGTSDAEATVATSAPAVVNAPDAGKPKASAETYTIASAEPDLEALGVRLGALVDFHVEAVKAAEETGRRAFNVQIRSDRDGGIHVELDSSVAAVMRDRKLGRMERQIKDLERHRMIIWKKNLQEEHSGTGSIPETAPPPDMEMPPMPVPVEAIESRLRSLEALRALEIKGYEPPVNAGRVEQFLVRQIRHAVESEVLSPEEKEALEGYLEKIDRWLDRATRDIEVTIESIQQDG